jgi:peptidoglycan/LPS O-acetylase OafA/YrhL
VDEFSLHIYIYIAESLSLAVYIRRERERDVVGSYVVFLFLIVPSSLAVVAVCAAVGDAAVRNTSFPSASTVAAAQHTSNSPLTPTYRF